MGMMGGGFGGQTKPNIPLADWARQLAKAGNLKDNRGQLQDEKSKETKSALDQAKAALAKGNYQLTQAGQLGVDLSVQSNQLKDQTLLARTVQRLVAGRTLIEIGGVWIDQGFDPKMPTVVVKAFSPAYFQLLERQPQLKELFQLGNYLVWVAPSGSALVIDLAHGEEKWDEAKMSKLFKEKGQ
jgi:Ca-activated chloride channel homolog